MNDWLKLEYQDLRKYFEIDTTIPLDESEQKRYEELERTGVPLPANIKRGDDMNKFYQIGTTSLNEDEIKLTILMHQAKNIKLIKNCVIFFTVIVILWIIAGVIYDVYMFNEFSDVWKYM